MMANRQMLAAQGAAVRGCQDLLDRFGWQGFIESSDHPAHDVRLLLEELIVLEGDLRALADLIDAGAGGEREIGQAEEIAGRLQESLAANRLRASSLREAHTVGEGILRDIDLLAGLITATLAAYRSLRPHPADGYTLAEALFGAH